MPAWRLGRYVGSLLVLAVLAVGAVAASAGMAGWSDRSGWDRVGVVASETSDEGEQLPPGSAFQTFGFEWS